MHCRGLRASVAIASIAVVVVPSAAQTPTLPKSAPERPVKPATSQKPAVVKSERPEHRTETVSYGAWTVSCTYISEQSAKAACSAVLQVIEKKRNQVLFAWDIGRDDKGVLRTVLETPTGVLIQKGVELKLDEAATQFVPYTACLPQECQASVVMDASFVKNVMASREAAITVHAINGRSITFKVPIAGIAKVLTKIGE